MSEDPPFETNRPDEVVLGERPAGDALVLEVARTRIADALFATGERVAVGRYQLLKHAGAGGMGVVWSAWDPELERRVALRESLATRGEVPAWIAAIIARATASEVADRYCQACVRRYSAGHPAA